MTPEYSTIGAIVVIVMAAFKFGEVLINKWMGNGTSNIRKQIDELVDNHIHGLQGILNKIDSRTEMMNNTLIEIKQILKK